MADTAKLSVHRCRFVDFTPAAITALAFPPLNLPSPRPANKGKAKLSPTYSVARFGTLAIGRANGNIELCEWTGTQGENQAPQAWAVRKACTDHVYFSVILDLHLSRHYADLNRRKLTPFHSPSDTPVMEKPDKSRP
jgi:U3 small nucleolar RNA-associated protein 4